MDRAQRRMIEAKMKAMRKPIDELRCSPCTISPERPRPPKSCDPDGTAIHPKPWGTNAASTTRSRPTPFQPASFLQAVAVCKGCRGNLAGGDRVTLHDNTRFHLKCFVCRECGERLIGDDDGNAEPARYFERCGSHYCEPCFKQQHGKTCGVCNAKLLRWFTRGGRAYCPEHEGEQLPSCLGCAQLLSKSNIATTLSDGRVACESCHGRAVTTVDEAWKLYREVVEYFRTRCGLNPLPNGASDLEIELLDHNALLAKMSTTLARGAHCCPLGLTTTEEMVNKSTGLVVPTSRKVKTISIVTNLPSDLCCAILAHEFGHVYMHLNGLDEAGPHGLHQRVAEGLCELFSYLWDTSKLKQQAAGERAGQNKTGLSTGVVAAERRRRLQMMETCKDTIYGAGFRDALAAYKSCGASLGRLLEKVRETNGELPRTGGPPSQAEHWAKRPGGRAFQGLGGAFQQAVSIGAEEEEGSTLAIRADARRRGKAFDEERRREEAANNAVVLGVS